ncbi:MAG: hypothetical protein WBO18_03395, partial [Gammaproteobacteria bacterium]
MTIDIRQQSLALIARFAILTLGLLAVSGAQAAQFVLDVVDGAGNPVSGFRYVLQEDTTFAVDPNNPATNADDILSLSFHASNQPVAKAQSDGSGLSGNTDGSSINITSVPPGRYYVSVLPYSGHSIGGMAVNVLPNSEDPSQTLDNVTVTVQANPIPTAQIALFLFQDNFPLNGAPDLPEEDPAASGVDWSQFNIILEEPAGRYGQNGGQVIANAFGDPLGTTYVPNCDPYTADCIATLGDGTLQPDPVTGTLLIKNLAPGKYGIIVNPPTGQGWQQTSTIEGTKVIDAWVKANEPPFFVEFGFPGPHVFMGFTQDFNTLTGAGATITGAVTDIHMSRPPVFDFNSGRAFPSCWTALNLMPSGETLSAAPCGPDSDFNFASVPAGSYTITIFDSNLVAVIATLPITVDPGETTCNGGGSCDLGPDVGVFNWFHRLNTAIFSDDNHNGFWDANEGPAGSERGPVQVRWRDGTIYQAFGTDTEGLAPFDTVFPFFHWLVAEVGFTRDKITGATFVVDAGGPVDKTTDLFPGFGELTPQEQCGSHDLVTGACIDPILNPNTGDNLSRTELGPVLTQAFQGFLGQTNVLQFGMAPYVSFTDPVFNFPDPPILPQFVGENGGISGMVLYATVRAEDDPELAAAEPWEPGVPRVQVALYADGDIDCFPQGDFPNSDCDIDWNGNGNLDPDDLAIDDVNGNGTIDLADVDNYPLGWGDPDCVNDPASPGNECNVGDEDIDRNADGVFDYGDALNVTWTDSWDDSQPTGCQGVNNTPASTIEPPITDDRCFDGMRNFNQVRPGVFDGGWAFADYSADALTAAGRGALVTKLDAFYANRIALVGDTDAGIPKIPEAWMIPGQYIVEAATPPGYKLMAEHHKNVDFGDEYVPAPQAFPAICVGDDHTVPPYLAMATKDGGGFDLIPGIDPADAAAPFADETRPLCDRKQLQLSSAQNAAVDFYVMTDVPIAGNVSGVALNDLANEFNPNSPAFGEKYAPPFTPVGFYDWNGAQVNRVYADQYGKFNALLPSTYTANLPQPSGMSPNMIVSCMNDAGPIPNPAFPADPDAPEFIVDPFFNPQFSQFCYTFQYMPGAITYLDTPVESIAAFANPIGFPVDCERPTRTPMIQRVQRRNNSGGGGPFVAAGGTVANPQQIRVLSMGGNVQVPNPEWDGVDQATRFITRNYNFGGSPGTLQLEDADGNRTDLNIINWSGTRIDAEVDPGQAPGEYQVIVTREGGVPDPVESPLGVTLTVGVNVAGTDYGVRPNSDGAPYSMDELYSVIAVGGNNGFATIQEGIDFAAAGDLILVAPGVYDELPIMYKPVKLQGWGAGAVTINARQVPTEKILAWRAKADQLVLDGEIDPLPGQDLPLPGFPALGAPQFATEEGAGIFVAGKRTGLNRFGRPENRGARIDGFTIVGASQGGAIVANGYNQFLNISNNRLTTNAGFFGGGIRIGHPTLTNEVDGLNHTDAVNDRIRIHHNHIAQNGNTFGGSGAGISLHTGADAYQVKQNWICGNYSQGDGAGIGHLGRSHRGVIEDNIINFNESFAQANPVDGGGIFVGGKPALQATNGLLLSPGSGTVTIDANIIRGNQAGAGDGGGIRIYQANGVDIANSLDA